MSTSSKTSISFLLSPSPDMVTTPPPPVKPRAPLERLPRALLSQIAYRLVTLSTEQHPSNLIPLLSTSKAINSEISFDSNPQLYNDLYRAKFDTAALKRRFAWLSKHMPKPAKAFDLFSDPRAWAVDYKNRWDTRRRMRRVAYEGTFETNQGDKDQLTADLYTVWFLITENDGKNYPFLLSCSFVDWISVYYREDMLKDSMVPGYPRETGHKSLGLWCTLLAGADRSRTQEEVDENIFIMRPYVFACAKYDITYAPWNHRQLPLCPPNCQEHEPDVTMRSKALPYKRFGYSWKRAPPPFIPGAYLFFFRLLDRGNSTTSLFPPQILPSTYHDHEWQRNSVCQDPHTSLGLPPLAYKSQIQGIWKGKFLFYDFETYRQILGGNLRGVYTAEFAEQSIEMNIVETIVKLPKKDVGGKGSVLAAGFQRESTEEEQRFIQRGCGFSLLDEEVEEEDMTNEILLSGTSRSKWGTAFLRGRVRAWDGLITLEMIYSTHVTGRWLWRGYLHTGGYLIGRWRDTFTAEHLRGYEGAFAMTREQEHPTQRSATSISVEETQSSLAAVSVQEAEASTEAEPEPEGVTDIESGVERGDSSHTNRPYTTESGTSSRPSTSHGPPPMLYDLGRRRASVWSEATTTATGSMPRTPTEYIPWNNGSSGGHRDPVVASASGSGSGSETWIRRGSVDEVEENRPGSGRKRD